MSSIINFIVEISDGKKEGIIEKLKFEATSMGISVWFDNFYVEDYIKEIKTTPALIFELSDNDKYCNCEDLVAPWWYDGVGEDLFKEHMRSITRIVLLCLQHATIVHLIIGMSGTQYTEMEHVHITPSDFFDDIVQRYNECIGVPTPPDVHYIFHPSIF